MKWLSNLLARLFKRKPATEWDAMDFGKPSTAGDEFRKRNEV